MLRANKRKRCRLKSIKKGNGNGMENKKGLKTKGQLENKH